MSKLIYGIGVNDSEYAVTKHDNTDSKRKIIWRCPVYHTWSLMLMRCFSEAYQSKYPTYVGCTVQRSWLRFSNFAKWMENQDYEGKCLDKDILNPSNKVYSPKTCVFIDNLTNTFVTDAAAARGPYPIGVSLHPLGTLNKYKATCRNPILKTREHLGSFPTTAQAHEAWRKRKCELACELAKLQTDPRVAKALRKRFKRT